MSLQGALGGNQAADPNLNPGGGNPAAAAAAAVVTNRERASATVDIEKFNHGKDEFDEWVGMLESAVELATNTTGPNLAKLCKTWLP